MFVDLYRSKNFLLQKYITETIKNHRFHVVPYSMINKLISKLQFCMKVTGLFIFQATKLKITIFIPKDCRSIFW